MPGYLSSSFTFSPEFYEGGIKHSLFRCRRSFNVNVQCWSPHVILHLRVLEVRLGQRPEIHNVSQLLEFGLTLEDTLLAGGVPAPLVAATNVRQGIQPANRQLGHRSCGFGYAAKIRGLPEDTGGGEEGVK
jgi:hypothetical protein